MRSSFHLRLPGGYLLLRLPGGYLLGWWAPWGLSEWWKLYTWRSSDEWHNEALSVQVPLLGAFHLWFSSWRDGSQGHFDPWAHPECAVCREFLREP